MLSAVLFAGCVSREAQVKLADLAKKEFQIGKSLIDLYDNLAQARADGANDITIGVIKEKIGALIADQKKIAEEAQAIKMKEGATWGGIIGGTLAGVVRGLPSKGPIPLVWDLGAKVLKVVLGRRRETG